MPMTVQEGTAVPVRITQDDTQRNIPLKPVPREIAGTTNSYLLTVAGGPLQILAHAPKRTRAVIIVNGSGNSVVALGGSQSDCQAAQSAVSGAGGNFPNSSAAQGAVTSAAAGGNISGTIAAAALPAGLYQVTATTYIDGTVAAATDDDNMKFNQSGGGIQTHISVPSNGQVTTVTMLVNFNGAQTIQISANNLATVASVYHASLVATPVSLLNQEGSDFIGEVVYVNGLYQSTIEVGSTDELWAALVAPGTQPIIVSVFKELEI
jgi:hypothetical protein